METVVKNIFGPIARRFGSMAAGALAGVAVLDPVLAERVELIAGAVVLLGVDLALSFLNRKSQEGL